MGAVAEDSRQAVDDMWHGIVEVVQIHDRREQNKLNVVGVGMYGSRSYEPRHSQFLKWRDFSLLRLLFLEGTAQRVSGNPLFFRS